MIQYLKNSSINSWTNSLYLLLLYILIYENCANSPFCIIACFDLKGNKNMEIKVDKYGSANCFSVPLTEAIKIWMTAIPSFWKQGISPFKDFSQERYIHLQTQTVSKSKNTLNVYWEQKNFNIEGNGATLVIHGDICSLGMINCQNVNINNLTIRYASQTARNLK